MYHMHDSPRDAERDTQFIFRVETAQKELPRVGFTRLFQAKV